MRITGFKAMRGSCEMVEMPAPRTVLNSRSPKPISSLPANLIEPLAIFPLGGSRPRTADPSVVFPEPDSPRIATISAVNIWKLTSLTAAVSAEPVRNRTVTPGTVRTGSLDIAVLAEIFTSP